MRRHSRRTAGAKGLPSALALIAAALGAPGGRAEELDLKRIFREGTPSSPFMNVVYRYAECMLDHGRDTFGPVKTGLFLSALDRRSLAPLSCRPPAPRGLPESLRPGAAGGPLVGASVLLDQNLLRLLWFLQGTSGEDRFPRAADGALRWFLQSAPSPETGLLPWGEGLSWDTVRDVPVAGGAVGVGGDPEGAEAARGPSPVWLPWSRSFEIAPEATRRYALALTRYVPSERRSRGADASPDGPPTSRSAARECAHALRAWAEAYASTAERIFLDALDRACQALERADLSGGSTDIHPADILSLAADCDGAARRVPQPLRGRLARLAARLDAAFLSAPHDVSGKRGFALSFGPQARESAFTPLWDPAGRPDGSGGASRGGDTTARVALICASRYENAAGRRFRDFVVAAAEAYIDSLPEEGMDAWPGTFGHAIELELAAFRATAREDLFRSATRLGEVAIGRFFDGSPLPRASLRSEHYESTTGAGTLALALVDLHLTTMGITAVRAPPNTVDR